MQEQKAVEEKKDGKPSTSPTDEDKNMSAVPPAWARNIEAAAPAGEPMKPDALMSMVKERLPFGYDIDIWEVLTVPGAQKALIEFINMNLPEGHEITTVSPKYGDYVIPFLFTDSYTEDHVIPSITDPAEGEYSPHVLPPVPKEALAALHALAEMNEKTDVFDVNTFWLHVRQHFPDIPVERTSNKPTVTNLLLQGQVAVSKEEQEARAAKSTELMNLMKAYGSGSSAEESPEPPEGGQLNVSQKPGDLTLALGAGLDTTIGEAIRMEVRTSMRQKTEEEMSAEERVMRKRQLEKESSSKYEVKRSRPSKDQK